VSNLPPFPDSGHLVADAGAGICDFCAPPQPSKWVYPCKSFLLPGEMQPMYLEMFDRYGFSHGGWGACVACACLVEAGNYDELARKSKANPHQRKVLALFEKNRIGERTPTDAPTSILYEKPMIFPA
jgi:hypothetical protein